MADTEKHHQPRMPGDLSVEFSGRIFLHIQEHDGTHDGFDAAPYLKDLIVIGYGEDAMTGTEGVEVGWWEHTDLSVWINGRTVPPELALEMAARGLRKVLREMLTARER
jgi:hypothetical protein